jgi:TonB-dependent siderophore receptor
MSNYKAKIFTLVILFFSPVLLRLDSANAQEELKHYFFKDSIVVSAQREDPIKNMSTVATGLPINRQNIPASIGIITESVNQNQNNFELSDALNNISGINVQSGFGVFDYFLIRGFDSNENGLILTDGSPEPKVALYNLYNIDQIEVLKGPGAYFWGGYPLAGTVNLVQKKPLEDNFLTVKAGAGQFNSYRGTVDTGFSNKENVATRLNVLWQQSDQYRDDKSSRIFAFNPTLRWNTKSYQLDFSFEYIDSEYKPDSGIPLKYNPLTGTLNQLSDIDRTTSYQTNFDVSNQNVYRAKMKVIADISDFISVKNDFYYTRLDWLSKGTLINGAYPDMTGKYHVNRSLPFLDDQQIVIGNRLESLFNFKANEFNSQLIGGIETSRLTDEFTYDIATQLPPIRLENPRHTLRERDVVYYPFQAGDAKSNVIAPYVINRLEYKRLNIYLGGRYDWIDFDEKIHTTSRSYRQFSPTFGSMFSLGKGIAIYANMGRAFSPPSTRVVGPQEPEKSSQLETGLKYQSGNGKIHTLLAFYNLEKDNIPVPNNIGILTQTGRQYSKGVEFELSAEPADGWVTIFAYSYTRAKLTEFFELVPTGIDDSGKTIYTQINRSGNKAPFAPAQMVRFWALKKFDFGLGLASGIQFIDDQYIAADNIYKINNYLKLDAMIFYKLGKIRIKLVLDNITNTEYVKRGFGNSAVLPADPLSIYTGIEFNL